MNSPAVDTVVVVCPSAVAISQVDPICVDVNPARSYPVGTKISTVWFGTNVVLLLVKVT